MIYEAVLSNRRVFVMPTTFQCPRRGLTALSLVCRQVKHETQPMFFSHCIFDISMTMSMSSTMAALSAGQNSAIQTFQMSYAGAAALLEFREWEASHQVLVDVKRFASLRRIYISRANDHNAKTWTMTAENEDKLKEVFGKRHLEIIYVDSPCR
jgi:hypothetical protein